MEPSWGTAPRLGSYTHYVDVGRLVPVAFFLSIVAAGPLWPAQRPDIARPVADRTAPDRPVIVCYGDSITAGNGLEADQAYPAFLQKKLDAAGYAYKVVNLGTSGATTKDALATLPGVLRLHPAIVIVEFGGNDGLRGLPVDQSLANLDQVLTSLQNAHIRIVLAGITLPPDYGPDYIRSFDQIFPRLAERHRVALIPMLYKNLVHVPGTIQADGIHPTAKGAAIIADTVFPVIKPMLRREPQSHQPAQK
jgi:acyl-CoA thioesterase-1